MRTTSRNVPSGSSGTRAASCARLGAGRLADEPMGLPAGAGLVWVGGFAFDPDGCTAPHFASLPPALMVVPEVAVARVDGTTYVTAAAEYRPGDDPDGLAARLADLLLDPARARAFGRRAVRRANALYTWSGVARSIADLYDDVLDAGRDDRSDIGIGRSASTRVVAHP